LAARRSIRRLTNAAPYFSARKPARPAKEATMELRMRLNVLAAIISFAFLTAIVFGMV
jgi:hypothetical protein